ncbi:MAG TPA: diacylglycerol kinase family protein [Pyrinomonadaceae bacterium]|jgi:YegS/Rv2252/BmrU family lipid kinase|nr:diacylglycerol kinase family protein [Pyrinomonadaceae bacterium]
MSIPLVIINPESAGGATRAAWPRIASELAARLGAFRPQFTAEPGQGIELAANAARKGTKLIIACGGDGTISEVANGILSVDSDAELGILPSGTGGDFRKTIGIPNRAAEAAGILRNGQTRLIDVGKVTFTKDDGEHESRYFLGIASFGMSAAVIARVKEAGPEWLPAKGPKWLTGRVAFGVAMVQTAAKTSATRVVVQLDDEPARHLTVANLCIANARYFGGGMKIAPNAKLADGKFDVVSIGDLGAARILANAPRLYLGAHLSMSDVGHALATRVVARPANPDQVIEIEVDGEMSGRLPATFQILPRALRVRCPQKAS